MSLPFSVTHPVTPGRDSLTDLSIALKIHLPLLLVSKISDNDSSPLPSQSTSNTYSCNLIPHPPMDPVIESLFQKKTGILQATFTQLTSTQLPDDELSALLPKLLELQGERHLFLSNRQGIQTSIIQQIDEINLHSSFFLPQPIPDAPISDVLASAVAILRNPSYAIERIPRTLQKKFQVLQTDFVHYANAISDSLLRQLVNLSQLSLLVPPTKNHFAGCIPPNCLQTSKLLSLVDKKLRLLSRLLWRSFQQYLLTFLADLEHFTLFIIQLQPIVFIALLHQTAETLVRNLTTQMVLDGSNKPRLERLRDQLRDLLIPPPFPPRRISSRRRLTRCRSCSPALSEATKPNRRPDRLHIDHRLPDKYRHHNGRRLYNGKHLFDDSYLQCHIIVSSKPPRNSPLGPRQPGLLPKSGSPPLFGSNRPGGDSSQSANGYFPTTSCHSTVMHRQSIMCTAATSAVADLASLQKGQQALTMLLQLPSFFGSPAVRFDR